MSETFVYRSRMPASAERVYQFHAEPDALARLTPPWENATVYEQTGGIEDIGSQVRIRLKIGPLSQTWVAEHAACEPGRMFRDVVVAGPFPKWEHTHLFIPDGADSSWLEDRVEYEMPLGWEERSWLARATESEPSWESSAPIKLTSNYLRRIARIPVRRWAS